MFTFITEDICPLSFRAQTENVAADEQRDWALLSVLTALLRDNSAIERAAPR